MNKITFKNGLKILYLNKIMNLTMLLIIKLNIFICKHIYMNRIRIILNLITIKIQ
jgi:hypothetical protein